MNFKNNTFLRLIAIFGKGKNINKSQISETHCKDNELHDFYCETEAPYIAIHK